jgi:hypothetical protein
MVIMKFILRHVLIYQMNLIELIWVTIKTAPPQYKQLRGSIQSLMVAITAVMLAILANSLSLTNDADNPIYRHQRGLSLIRSITLRMNADTSQINAIAGALKKANTGPIELTPHLCAR